VLITFITAAAALGGTALATWRQNRRAGREEWVRRLQWAEELASEADMGRRARGRAAMNALAGSGLATREDSDFIAGMTDLTNLRAIEEALMTEAVDSLDFIEDNDGQQPEETSP